jgi:hypothetical protein
MLGLDGTLVGKKGKRGKKFYPRPHLSKFVEFCLRYFDSIELYSTSTDVTGMFGVINTLVKDGHLLPQVKNAIRSQCSYLNGELISSGGFGIKIPGEKDGGTLLVGCTDDNVDLTSFAHYHCIPAFDPTNTTDSKLLDATQAILQHLFACDIPAELLAEEEYEPAPEPEPEPREGPIKELVLYTGYVESGSNGCVLMKHAKGFNTLKEALTHIGGAMKAVAEYHAREYLKDCCKKSKSAKFCPECGRKITTEVGKQEIEDEFLRFFNGVSDDSHDHYEFLNGGGWSYWDNFKFDKNVVWIKERAEELIAALGAGDEEAFRYASQLMRDVEFE